MEAGGCMVRRFSMSMMKRHKSCKHLTRKKSLSESGKTISKKRARKFIGKVG